MSVFFYRLFTFVFFFDFLLTLFVAGQENYAIKTFTTDQGLPHNNVRGIVQDQNGFLWIATWDGLSRWDGYEFKNYYHNPADSTSLVYFQTDNILVDYQNNVWVNCYSGVSKYNRNTDNFTQFSTMRVGGIALDQEGKFWVSAKSGLYRWNYEVQKFELVSVELDQKEKLRGLGRMDIGFDNENRLWIYTVDVEKNMFFRCNKFENNGLKGTFLGEFSSIKYFPNLNNYTWKFKCWTFGANSFWITSNLGLYFLDPKTKEFMPGSEVDIKRNGYGLNASDLRNLTEDLEYNKPLLRNAELQLEINPTHVEDFLIDRQNTIWQGFFTAGSIVTGLTRSIPTLNGFKHYFTVFNPDQGLNSFSPVLRDKNGIVWGGATNLNAFFQKDKYGLEKKIVPLSDEVWKIASRPRTFLEDSSGIWLGYLGGLFRYDFVSRQFKSVITKKTLAEDKSLPQSFVHLKQDGNDLLIVGFTDIFRYKIKTSKLQNLKQFSNEENDVLYSVARDKTGGWWIGANLSRLFHFDNDFKVMKTFKIGKGNFNIEDIIEGDNNDLWISQLGGGLAHFDMQTSKSVIYTTADGLSNNTCYGILKDMKGNIWVSTNHGISRFNPKTKQFRIFNADDGLKIDEFNSDNTYQSPDGELFFAGMGGVVSFYPDSLSDTRANQTLSPVVIEDFKVSGSNRYFSKAVYECDTVVLNKGDTNFQLSFACLDFQNAEKIKYRYKLNGEDHDFVLADFRHRSINYSSLSPGKYDLIIEATNRDGDWASSTSLCIIIPAYFYQTVWFRVLIVVVLILSAGHFIYTYNHRIRLKAKQQQEELRLESLRGQMNPHFIFNSLNSINYFISQNDRLSANRYIADFSRLIRSILGNMSNEYIPLSLELQSLHDYLKLEHLRFGDKFDYTIQVYEGILPEEQLVFPGMVQPFIENAIWHGVRGLEGRKGMVTVEFRMVNRDCLICVIEDDGIGRKRSEKCKSNLPGKTSRGIGIVMERLRIINNLRQTNFQVKIDDLFNDREETGTRVIIEIPLKM